MKISLHFPGYRQVFIAGLLTCWLAGGQMDRMLMAQVAPANVSPQQQEVLFENSIRPLLVNKCIKCHGPDKQQGELRLDSAAAVTQGNSAGPAVVPGNVDGSRLWTVIQYSPDDTQMPPDGKLSDEEIQLLAEWIRTGAYWPHEEPQSAASHSPLPRNEDGSIDFAEAATQHWAWQPVRQPDVPDSSSDLSRTPIDRFVEGRLSSVGLAMSPEADRRTLIRRLSFDLTGLPATFEETREFVNGSDPDDYERLVDRMLASPAYGQRWGRHWLDLARYADTKGYVFTENRFYPYSYTYRDYVVGALNADKPYDRFVTEQIAADQLGLAENDPDLAALGFLTVGARFLNREPDIIDDRIDVVTRGLMGLTVGCARCHDHKYDPIPTEDYYSLYGVFASSEEPDLPPLIGEVDESSPGYATFKAELDKRQEEVRAYAGKSHAEMLENLKMRAGDHLQGLVKSLKRVPEGIEPQFNGDPPREQLVRRWGDFVTQKSRDKDASFVLFDALTQLPAENFGAAAKELIAKAVAGQEGASALNSLLLAELNATEHSDAYSVARSYGKAFEKALASAEGSDPASDELRKLLIGDGSVSDVAIVEGRSPLFGRDHRDKLRALNRKVDEWRVESPDAPARAMVLLDKPQPHNPVVFQRGDPGRPGQQVPRRFPRILGRGEDRVFQTGSGRLELAQRLTSPDNPLTARAIVNRVWMHHFGAGLVNSGGDFGSRGTPPTHPELLDHLAWRLVHEWNWSLKALHREILLSHVYRQSSVVGEDSSALAADEADPENLLLWRQNRKRLEFEPFRDSLLQAAGLLRTDMGGRPVNFEEHDEAACRTIYGLIDRNNIPTLYRTFDFPSPDTSSPGRPQTTVPQQALFSLNADFVERCAMSLADAVREQASAPDAQATRVFELALGRAPDDEEYRLVTSALGDNRLTLDQISQALLMSNEFVFVD